MSKISGLPETKSFVVKDVCDHWKNYTYHDRYLDALAGIFAVQKPCAAIVYFSTTQKFYLSYNAEATDSTRDKIGIIRQTLNDFNRKEQVEHLLFLYIAYNTDFKGYLSQNYKIFENIDVYGSISSNEIRTSKEDNRKKVEEDLKQEIIKLIGTINNINKQSKKSINPEKIKSLKEQKEGDPPISNNDSYLVTQYTNAIGSYNRLLTLLSDIEPLDKSDDFLKLSQFLLRPLQDIEKVVFYLKGRSISVKQDGDIIVIDNPNRAHAEVNLAKEFSHLKIYIGVSRLCCGICDYLLDDIYHHKHRGTHGTCDDGWSAPSIQFQNTFKELHEKSTNFDQTTLNKQFSKQHRKLSHDNLPALLLSNEENSAQPCFQRYKEILLGKEMETSDFDDLH